MYYSHICKWPIASLYIHTDRKGQVGIMVHWLRMYVMGMRDLSDMYAQSPRAEGILYT